MMAGTDDLHALQQAAQSVLDMRDGLHQQHDGAAGPAADFSDIDDRIATIEARLDGFYWVILGQNPPEIAYWERGEWWLAGEPRPWQPEAVTVVSDRLVFKPKLVPVA
jgi:hypothetical protein